MKSMLIGEFKTHFSDVLQRVREGESVTIEYGKRRKKVAVLVPFTEYAQKQPRQIGVMEGKGQYRVRDNFRMTDEEFLTS